MRLSKANLANAMQIFAVANTPLFIARKLKTDPTVVGLSQSNSSEEIFKYLMKATSVKPKDLRSAVLPYVYLVALALKQDLKSLEAARRLNAIDHDWYGYVANALYQMMPSITASQNSLKTPSISVAPQTVKPTEYQFNTLTITQ